MKKGLLLLVLILTGCGEDGATPEPTATEKSEPALEEPQTPSAPNLATATLHAIDLDGNPLADLMPIATFSANAFDRPIAHGGPTNAEGLGELRFPTGQTLYIRPWDPTFRYFATNFFEVLPAAGSETRQMDFVMAKGASLRATVYNPQGEPIFKSPVNIMLEHGAQGPWWPDQAISDALGNLEFPSLPPGEYTAKLAVQNVGAFEISDVALPPGGEADLGAIRLLASN